MNTGTDDMATGGTNTNALSFGGNPGSVVTEEWYGDGILTETFTTS